MVTANCGGLIIDDVTLKVNSNKELYAVGGDSAYDDDAQAKVATIGTVANLTTTAKTDLVSAINELVTRIATLESAT